MADANTDTAGERAWAALRRFGREPGRSVAVRVLCGRLTWQGSVNADVPRPAASLLKVPLAMAAEAAVAADPGGGLAGAEAPVDELVSRWHEPTVLHALNPDRRLRVEELIRLAVSCSDGPSAAWLLDAVGLAAVREHIRAAGCTGTDAWLAAGAAGGSLVGLTTAADALSLLARAVDRDRFPLVAAALQASTLNSRIPLGVDQRDVAVAHKTGTLLGVAHDVALLNVSSGEIWLAFLTDAQHDTLVTGYEMGLCTQEILTTFGASVTGTRSLVGPDDGNLSGAS